MIYKFSCYSPNSSQRKMLNYLLFTDHETELKSKSSWDFPLCCLVCLIFFPFIFFFQLAIHQVPLEKGDHNGWTISIRMAGN